MPLLRWSPPCLAWLLAAACSAGAVQPGDPRPDVVVATVVSVEPPSAYTRVLVDTAGRAAEGNPAPRFYLVVSDETAVVVRRPGLARRGRVGDIQPGARVRAWRTGVELRSLPPQYPTTRIEVTPPAAP
jgi:hypothetical protein